MRCFFCEEIGGIGTAVNFSPGEQRHLFSVLRSRSGDQVEIIDGRGTLARAEINEEKQVNILTKEELPEPVVKIHLFVAPPRRQQMDQLLKQAAEVGVWGVYPMITEHGVAKPGKPAVVERWRCELIAGCKQAHNPFLPQLNPSLHLEDAAALIKERNWPAFYGDPQGGDFSLDPGVGEMAWLVGPEGGFSGTEKALLQENGCLPLRLGRWVMRIETAAIVGAGILQCKRD